MKRIFVVFLVFAVSDVFSQSNDYEQNNFCRNLYKVFELGRKDNFSAYNGTVVKQSAFLRVPGYSIKLDRFPENYVDKNNRFVAKTLLNFDSLSALQHLEELKSFVGYCLDSAEWNKWSEASGDDSSTYFFKEMKEAKTVAKDLSLTLAVVIAAPKVYTVSLYIRRRK